MANIKNFLDNILNARFGKDVRSSIHDGIEAINKESEDNIEKQQKLVNENIAKQNELERKYDEQIKNIASENVQNAEIVDARMGFDTLGNVIKKKIYHFENVEEIKRCKILREGDTVETLGYYEANDGGAGKYRIVLTEAEEDGGSILRLDNGFSAELIVKNGIVNVKQFGAKGNKTFDDTVSIQNALNFNSKVFINEGDYLIQGIVLNNNQHIFGSDLENTILESREPAKDDLVETNSDANNIIIENLTLRGNYRCKNALHIKRNEGTINGQYDSKHVLRNIRCMYANECGVLLDSNNRECQLEKIDSKLNNKYGIYVRGTDNYFTRCSIHSNVLDGMYITGSNNKIVNCKFYINGKTSEFVESCPGGLTIEGVMNVISACEIQENIYDGIKLKGYLNTITGCLIDSNGSDNYEYKYSEASGIRILPDTIGRAYSSSFNILTGNVITSHHVSGQQKYGIYISNKGEYRNNPSYNVIDSIVESDMRHIHTENKYNDFTIDTINLYEDIPNYTNSITINGENCHKNIITLGLIGLAQDVQNTSPQTFIPDNIAINEKFDAINMTFNTYINTPAKQRCLKSFVALNESTSNNEFHGIIIKYKARTSNPNIAALAYINCFAKNSKGETIRDYVVLEDYASKTKSSEWKDCVAVLDVREIEDFASTSSVTLFFGAEIQKTLEQNVGEIQVGFKDISYYIF